MIFFFCVCFCFFVDFVLFFVIVFLVCLCVCFFFVSCSDNGKGKPLSEFFFSGIRWCLKHGLSFMHVWSSVK